MIFTLSDIPAAMRQEGWPIGAAVMERWFAGAARTMSRAEKEGNTASRDVETRLVTIGWCRGFARFLNAENELIATWATPGRLARSRETLTRKVLAWRQRIGAQGSFRFGDLHAPTATIDRTCQVNIQSIDSAIFGDVDDFYAAIGRGAVKIAVSGEVSPPDRGRVRLTIDQIATYLRDTYDFNGDQMLGSWGPTGLRRSAFLAPNIQIVREKAKAVRGQAFWSVGNASFRDWRNHYGRGGDFTIFSNVSRRRPVRPVVLDLSL